MTAHVRQLLYNCAGMYRVTANLQRTHHGASELHKIQLQQKCVVNQWNTGTQILLTYL